MNLRPLLQERELLEPVTFNSVNATRLTLQENKVYKNEVVPSRNWVTKLLREFMTWERAAHVTASPSQNSSARSSANLSSTANGGRGHLIGGQGGQSGGGRDASGARSVRVELRSAGAGNTQGGAARASLSSTTTTCHDSASCLKCGSRNHLVHERARHAPGEAGELMHTWCANLATPWTTHARRLRDNDDGTVDAVVD